MFIFTNSFHNSSVSIRVNLPGETQKEQFFALQFFAHQERKPGKYTRLLKRVRKKLCGCAGCACGTIR